MEIKGCYTALVTPFKDGDICYSTLTELIEDQIRAGIDGLVPVGTTGESPTLNFQEHKDLIEKVVGVVDKRCKVIAGTGGNSTEEALELTRFASELGADASLQVTPYYNKPSQEGLYQHFSKIADATDLPIVLYNIPGRTGIEIDLNTVKRLAQNSNIVAIKEASPDIERVSQILKDTSLYVLSGDDSKTVPMIALGAHGVISVASNLLPREIMLLTHSALNGDLEKSRSIHYKLYAIFEALFIETNPIPIKTALAMTRKIQEEFRLPLCPISHSNKAKLVDELKKIGIV